MIVTFHDAHVVLCTLYRSTDIDLECRDFCVIPQYWNGTPCRCCWATDLYTLLQNM